MKWFTTSLATVAALVAGGLVAVPAPASASPAAAKHAGILHVYDSGSLFTENGINRAKAAMGNVQFDHGLTLTIDTHSTVPNGKAVPTTDGEKARFFEQWAKDLATGDRAKGIYVLVNRSPGYVQVIADKAARDRGFTNENEQRLRDTLLNSFKEAAKHQDDTKKQFEIRDEALLTAVNFVITDLKDTVAAGTRSTPATTTTTPKTETPKKQGMTVGGWICLGICVLLCIWLVVGLIRALTAPSYGGGYGGGGGGYGGGGGGFGTALLGGMFGAMAGMYLYNSMMGTHYPPQAFGGEPTAGDTGTTGGDDAAAGDGDFGGDAGAGGSYDDGGSGGDGGGDYGGDSGGGDYGGGGGDYGGGGGDYGGGGGDYGGGDF